MNKIIIFLTFFILIFFISCAGKAPACTDLSWNLESYENEFEIAVMYSAGTNCKNISEYYDITANDINNYTSVLIGKEFSLNDVCMEFDPEEEKEVEVECPDFIPTNFSFGEMVGCHFTTPPAAGVDCPPNSPVSVSFSCQGALNDICSVGFLSDDDLSGKTAENFISRNDTVVFKAVKNNEKEYIATVEWDEEIDGIKEEKSMTLKYSVEQ
jgi:hypothetical protein